MTIALLVSLVGQATMPMCVGFDLQSGTRPLRRAGLAVRYVQVEAETAAARQFFIVGQRPDSGAAVAAGDSVEVRFNCTGLLRYWHDWAVPLLGDFRNNVDVLNATKRPEQIVAPQAAYPRALAANEFSGSAEVAALVDFDGSVLAARVTRSAGFAAADSEACNAALKSSFSPGENRGEPCRVWMRLPYSWQYSEYRELKSSKPGQGYDATREQ
jgi:TonB family protein